LPQEKRIDVWDCGGVIVEVMKTAEAVVVSLLLPFTHPDKSG